MGFDRVLLDTNVCIDAIHRRKPHDAYAQRILDMSEREIFKGYVAAHTFDTIFYILIKNNTVEHVYQAIEGLRKTVNIATVSRGVIDKALELKWPDFEDAIHYQSALDSKCDAIISRNPQDFIYAEIPVLLPLQFLESIQSDQE